MEERVLVIKCRAMPFRRNQLKLASHGAGTITAFHYLEPNNDPHSLPELITTAEAAAQKPLLDYLDKLVLGHVVDDFMPVALNGRQKPIFWCQWNMNRMYLTQPDDAGHVFGFNRDHAVAPSDEDIVRLQDFLTDAYRQRIERVAPTNCGPRFGLD